MLYIYTQLRVILILSTIRSNYVIAVDIKMYTFFCTLFCSRSEVYYRWVLVVFEPGQDLSNYQT